MIDTYYEIFKNSKYKVLENLSESLNEINNSELNTWHKVQLSSKRRFGVSGGCSLPSNTFGIYMLLHTSSSDIWYVGMGNLGSRICRFKSVFLNNGKNIKHSGGSNSDHIGARKAFKFDANINNWYMLVTDVLNISLRTQYESSLIEYFKPDFNVEAMAGK